MRALAALLLALAAASSASAQVDPVTCRGIAGRATFDGPLEQGALLRGRAPAGIVRITHDGREVPMAPDRTFLFGVDRDAGAALELDLHHACGRTDSVPLQIRPRAWPVQHVNIARRPGGATADFLRRREPELARIAAARARGSDAQGWRQNFTWPARGRISGRFGAQRIYRGEPASYHSGVDVAPGAGAPVAAPADGVVVLAGAGFSLEGNLVIIDHGLGLNSAFLHLARIDVSEGQRVRQGEGIGTVGATGRATGPHLHWSLTWRGARLDPQRVAGAMN